MQAKQHESVKSGPYSFQDLSRARDAFGFSKVQKSWKLDMHLGFVLRLLWELLIYAWICTVSSVAEAFQCCSLELCIWSWPFL